MVLELDFTLILKELGIFELLSTLLRSSAEGPEAISNSEGISYLRSGVECKLRVHCDMTEE